MLWTKSVSIEDLEKKQVMVFRHKAKQIAVVRQNQQIFALDNRCPHEGYPLSRGTIGENCVLTCQWHNWKFDLATGECVVGGDDVRTYPTKEEAGFIWVDLAPLPPEMILKKISKSLLKGLHDRDLGQISRELIRFHFNQLDPLNSIPQILEWSHSQLEFGSTHAYAGLADWLGLYDAHSDDFELQLTCLTEALDHIAWDVMGHQEYPYPEGRLPYTGNDFLKAIEAEDEKRAIALMRGALQAGLGIDDLEKTLTAAALNHYNDFGHSLIYVLKTTELIQRLGKSVETPLLFSLIRHLCYTTREDLLPDFSKYGPSVEKMPEFPKIATTAAFEKIPEKSIGQSLAWVVEAAASHSPEAIFAQLLEANAKNLLKMDETWEVKIHQKPKDNIGWLDFTHGLTFSNAVRQQCEKFPEFWKKGLLQMACFYGRNLPYLQPSPPDEQWAVEDSDTFWKTTIDGLLDHGVGLPIYSVHRLKTSIAVREETRANPKLAPVLLAALNRFLNARPKQKQTRRLIHQGVELVAKDF